MSTMEKLANELLSERLSRIATLFNHVYRDNTADYFVVEDDDNRVRVQDSSTWNVAEYRTFDEAMLIAELLEFAASLSRAQERERRT